MNQQLKNHILQFARPEQKVFAEFASFLEYQQVNKKEFILKKGEYCRHQYFILKGCFHYFFIDKKGTQKSINFGIENWWITDFNSFINSCQTDLFIQATEDSQVLRINKKNLEYLLSDSLEINKYFRRIMEQVRIADQRRMQYMSSLSSKELYALFCENYPNFLQRIPLYILASYLGFTPEFLSKIRSEK